MLWLILCLVVVLPIYWLVSEFQDTRWVRIVAGIAALSMCYFVAWGVGMLQCLNYNANYGGASAQLIETVIVHAEGGNTDVLVNELKALREKYHPTYESTANYDHLVEEFVDRMKAASADTRPPEDDESQGI